MSNIVGNGAPDIPINNILQTSVLNTKGVVTSYSAPFTGPWVRFSDCQFIVQVEGTATSFTGFVQVTACDPALNSTLTLGAPASTTTYSGNLATGIPADIYTECSIGWYRWVGTAVGGGYAIPSLRGKGSGQ